MYSNVQENVFVLGLAFVLLFYTNPFGTYFYNYLPLTETFRTTSILLTTSVTLNKLSFFNYSHNLCIIYNLNPNIIFLIKVFTFKCLYVFRTNTTMTARKSLSFTWLRIAYLINIW